MFRGFDLVLATKRCVPLDYTLTKEEGNEGGGRRVGASEGEKRRGGATKRGRFSVRDHGMVNRAKSVINHGEFVVINEDRVVPASINTVNTRQMNFAY